MLIIYEYFCNILSIYVLGLILNSQLEEAAWRNNISEFQNSSFDTRLSVNKDKATHFSPLNTAGSARSSPLNSPSQSAVPSSMLNQPIRASSKTPSLTVTLNQTSVRQSSLKQTTSQMFYNTKKQHRTNELHVITANGLSKNKSTTSSYDFSLAASQTSLKFLNQNTASQSYQSVKPEFLTTLSIGIASGLLISIVVIVLASRYLRNQGKTIFSA